MGVRSISWPVEASGPKYSSERCATERQRSAATPERSHRPPGKNRLTRPANVVGVYRRTAKRVARST
jgi:hypothetical protein